MSVISSSSKLEAPGLGPHLDDECNHPVSRSHRSTESAQSLDIASVGCQHDDSRLGIRPPRNLLWRRRRPGAGKEEEEGQPLRTAPTHESGDETQGSRYSCV
jgi:hypothetical protein